MPDWIKGVFVLGFCGISIVWALSQGKINAGAGTITRSEQPTLFYGFIGMLLFVMVVSVFILLTQAGAIPDFINR
jgi:hypothetical protein